mgnify:CR=1 FL=1
MGLIDSFIDYECTFSSSSGALEIQGTIAVCTFLTDQSVGDHSNQPCVGPNSYCGSRGHSSKIVLQRLVGELSLSNPTHQTGVFKESLARFLDGCLRMTLGVRSIDEASRHCASIGVRRGFTSSVLTPFRHVLHLLST